MKISSLQTFAVAAATLLALPAAYGATITYDAGNSMVQPNGNPSFAGYGSAGYLFDATAPVSSGAPSGVDYTGVNPLNFSENQASASGTTTFATTSMLPAGITAANIGGNYVVARGLEYGTLPNGIFSYIGSGGTMSATSADEFSITFNLASTGGYRIAILTQSNGNGGGVNGVSLYNGGTSLVTATSSATNPAVLTGGTAFYSFDVTNIIAGDTVTVNLSNPQGSGDLQTYGFTLDALPVPEPSTYAICGVALLGMAWMGLRNRSARSLLSRKSI